MTLSGKTIRGYEIGDRISSGGYGEVYRARQLSVKRDVAIKVILPQYANNPKFMADFEAEAQLVARLEHTNIVPLHDYWQDDTGAFLVMRYVRGGSLKDMLNKQGSLPLSHTVRLIEQIADALYAAHEANVIHRDLKPDNILIDERSNAYLTDFGIAKQLGGDQASATEGIKGTFAYLSPEQIQRTGVSPQTDIYALGVMLYEMLAGQHPFHHEPIGILLMKHLQDPLPSITKRRGDLNPEIDRIIQRATEKHPDKRYRNTLDMVADLKGVVEDTASVSRSVPTSGRRATTTEERNRSAMLANVRNFWVEGVLENSLHHAAQIKLNLKPEEGKVATPWDAVLRTPGGDEHPVSQSIEDVFDRQNGKLLVLGDPASGKTTTLLTLARELLNRAEKDASHPIPVVLNLSSWGERPSTIDEWMVEELNLVYQVPRNVSRKWVGEDDLLLLLDGLDEVNESARDACVQALNDYRRGHGFVDMVVCSRIADYERLNTQLLVNGAVIIQPLNRVQVTAYFRQLGSNFKPFGHLVEIDDPFFELCRSPLMLSVIALAYKDRRSDSPGEANVETLRPDALDAYLDTALLRQSHAEATLETLRPDGLDDRSGSALLPQSYSTTNVETLRNEVFDAYLNSALRRQSHDSVYSDDLIVSQLRWLAQRMQNHGQSVFQIEEMQPSWLGDKGEARFLWWYFAAGALMWSAIWVGSYNLTLLFRGISLSEGLLRSLAGVLVGIPIAFLWTRRNYAKWYMPLITGVVVTFAVLVRGPAPLNTISPLQTLVTGIISTAGVTWLILLILVRQGYQPTTIVPFERLRFSRAHIRWWPSVLTGLIIAVAILGFRTPHLHPENAGVAFAAVFILPILIVIYLTGLISDDIDESSQPNQGVRNSFRNGMLTWLRVGVICFLSVAIAHTFLNNIWIATAEGLYIALQTGFNLAFAFGLAPALQHLVLRGILSRQHGLPWNYAAFLDYASRLVLLRRVGGSYIFIHRYLLEYFAGLKPDPQEN